MEAQNQVARVRAGRRLARFHSKGYDARFFGPAGAEPLNRYDAPDGSYKIFYAAFSLRGAVGEVLIRNPARRYVMMSEIEAYASATFVLGRDVTLAALHDERMSSWGVSLTDLTARSYAVTQALGAQIYADPRGLDGILYPSRFSNRPCIALFDRAETALVRLGPSRPLQIERIEKLAAGFGKTVADDSL